ncbi:hypothetical protein FSY45_24765 [Comamonas sp. Z1]|nr:hypothetical protein FSY45_24765 [Comamonas sp. Z1]
MVLTIKDLLDRVAEDLQDKKSVRWTRLELLAHFNEAQRKFAEQRPDQMAGSIELELVAGWEQHLPASVLALIDITHNVNRQSKRITKTSMWQLDVLAAGWRAMSPASDAAHFMWDSRYPKDFAVYPPVKQGCKVHAIVSKATTDASTEASQPSVPPQWMDALRNYVMFRAYSKDAEYGNNTELAAASLQLFNDALGVQVKAANNVAPTN